MQSLYLSLYPPRAGDLKQNSTRSASKQLLQSRTVSHSYPRASPMNQPFVAFGGQVLSVAVLNPLVGILGYISIWFASFLFSGFFLPENDVPWPLKVCRMGIWLRDGGIVRDVSRRRGPGGIKCSPFNVVNKSVNAPTIPMIVFLAIRSDQIGRPSCIRSCKIYLWCDTLS